MSSNTGIYIIQSPTNRIYIGQSTNLSSRKNNYASLRCEGQPLIHRSIKKYGFDAHQFNVILELKEDISQSQLDYWEQFFIDHYRNEGYQLMNLREGGSHGRMSEETKLKMRLSKQNISESFRKQVSERFKGKPLSEEHKNKISTANKTSLINSEKFQKNVIDVLRSKKGKKMSIEARENMKRFTSRHKNSPEHLEKLKAYNTNRIHTEEEKNKRNWAVSNFSFLQVRIIIHCIEFGMSCRDIGKIFNVSKSSISDIKFGRTFQKIPRIIPPTVIQLMPEQIRVIAHYFELDNSKGANAYLSRIFKVSRPTISEIKNGKRWKSIINQTRQTP